MGNNERVRAALKKAREVAARQPGRVPKLDAVVAVLNADNIDRGAGRTHDNTASAGSRLAMQVRV